MFLKTVVHTTSTNIIIVYNKCFDFFSIAANRIRTFIDDWFNLTRSFFLIIISDIYQVSHGVSQAIVNSTAMFVVKIERHIIEPTGYIHQTLTVLTLRGKSGWAI